MNRASALLNLPCPPWPEAVFSARRALAHSRTCEADDALATEAGVKARHILCRCLAHLLETPPVDAAHADEWILEATDAVEDVMRLTKGDSKHQALRDEMFHFGCRIYRAFQPHFLAEFLDDGLADGGLSEAMHLAAQEALVQASLQMRQENLAGYTNARLDRLLDTLQAFLKTGNRLQTRAARDV